MRTVLLLAGGAIGAVLARHVYANSVAFPRGVQKVMQKAAADIKDQVEFFREMDQLPLSQDERAAAAAGYLRGRGIIGPQQS